MEDYVVEGRHFDIYLHAITFANRIASEMNRAVDVRRSVDWHDGPDTQWRATMHPPGFQRLPALARKQAA